MPPHVPRNIDVVIPKKESAGFVDNTQYSHRFTFDEVRQRRRALASCRVTSLPVPDPLPRLDRRTPR